MKKQKQSFGKRLQKGLEVLSSIPRTLHIKPRRPVSEDQRFRQWLHAESARAAREGEDTYEEFTDFGPADPSELPDSPYELVFDPLSGKEVLPGEKIWLDKQRAQWSAQEAEKRKAERLKKEQESAIDDYVTRKTAAEIRKPAKKTGKALMDESE